MSAELFRVFLMVFNVVLGIASGVIVFYLYNLRNDFRVQAERSASLKDDLGALEKTLPREFVLREDYVRTMAAFQHKLDKTLEIVGKIDIGERNR